MENIGKYEVPEPLRASSCVFTFPSCTVVFVRWADIQEYENNILRKPKNKENRVWLVCKLLGNAKIVPYDSTDVEPNLENAAHFHNYMTQSR